MCVCVCVCMCVCVCVCVCPYRKVREVTRSVRDFFSKASELRYMGLARTKLPPDALRSVMHRQIHTHTYTHTHTHTHTSVAILTQLGPHAELDSATPTQTSMKWPPKLTINQ